MSKVIEGPRAFYEYSSGSTTVIRSMKYYLTWLHHNAKGKTNLVSLHWDGSKKQPDGFLSSHQRAYGLIYLPEGGAINEKLNTRTSLVHATVSRIGLVSTVASIRSYLKRLLNEKDSPWKLRKKR